MIDWQRVETLLEDVGGEDFCEVVEIFLDESDAVIDRLAAAPDPARFEEDLHFLKGSALNLGFEEMAAICGAGERLASQGAADQVDIAAVLTCYRASVEAFQARARQLCQRSSAA